MDIEEKEDDEEQKNNNMKIGDENGNINIEEKDDD